MLARLRFIGLGSDAHIITSIHQKSFEVLRQACAATLALLTGLPGCTSRLTGLAGCTSSLLWRIYGACLQGKRPVRTMPSDT